MQELQKKWQENHPSTEKYPKRNFWAMPNI